MKKIILPIFLMLFILILTSCGSDYNTDFEPPPPNAALDDVFPKMIDGSQSNVTRMNLEHPLEGFIASYKDGDITIEAILAPDADRVDNYFKETLAPKYDGMKNHFRGSINGRWKADGTDNSGRKWFAWQNKTWIFQLSGKTSADLSNAIKAFKFVSE